MSKERIYPTPAELIQRQIAKIAKDKQTCIDQWDEEKYKKVDAELQDYFSARTALEQLEPKR